MQGEVLSGWQDINGYRFYFNPDDNNHMVTGVTTIDDIVYSFDADGIFLHEGDHVDADNDGICDLCFEASSGLIAEIVRFLIQVVQTFIDILSAFQF